MLTTANSETQKKVELINFQSTGLQSTNGPESADGAGTPPVEHVVQRVLTSKTFRKATSLRSLLSYVVHNVQAGIPCEETRIAQELLGKGASYDPVLDPTIRVQIGRLRKLLDRYYSGEGSSDSIQVQLPRGSYTPSFRVTNATKIGLMKVPESTNSEETMTEESPNRLAGVRSSLAVLPFSNLTNDRDQDAFCHGLTEEIVTTLAKMPEVDVIASSSGFQYKDELNDVRDVGRELGVPLILEGSVRREGDHTRVTAQLARVEDGVAIWSETLDSRTKGSLSMQKELAQRVIESLPLPEPVSVSPDTTALGVVDASS